MVRLALVALLLGCAPRAQPLPLPDLLPQPPDTELRTTSAGARDAFARAVRAYDAGTFRAAIELFKEAYDRSTPHGGRGAPAILFDLARCYDALGDCQDAIYFYKQFVRLSPRSPAADPVKRRLEALLDVCPSDEHSAALEPR